MKKITLSLSLALLCSLGFSQKTVTIYNFSSKIVNIGQFNTGKYTTYIGDSSNSGSTIDPLVTATIGWPKYQSWPQAVIYIPPGGTYTLTHTNNTYFPFYSPTSSPVINQWRRQSASGGAWTVVTSASLNNSLAVPQRFDFVKFQVLDATTNANLGGGNLGVNYPAQISNPGFTADFAIDPMPITTAPTTVVFKTDIIITD